MNIENVGAKFNQDLFDQCRAKAWELLEALAQRIEPGMRESDGHQVYRDLCREFKIEKNWHPPKIRFGANSTKGFREVSDPEIVLQKQDIFFLDIGPVIFDHEGDVGKTFFLANEPSQTATTISSAKMYQQACKDSEEIWQTVGDHWRTQKVSGEKLYEFANVAAEKRGWKLNLFGASGHRIGDFPHAVYHKGSLKDFQEVASPERWILEIQVRHPELPFGAFYEDVLR